MILNIPLELTQIFTNASTVTVTHNLNKHPNVIVIDSAGTQYHGIDVKYTSINEFIVSWVGTTSGTIIYK